MMDFYFLPIFSPYCRSHTVFQLQKGKILFTKQLAVQVSVTKVTCLSIRTSLSVMGTFWKNPDNKGQFNEVPICYTKQPILWLFAYLDKTLWPSWEKCCPLLCKRVPVLLTVCSLLTFFACSFFCMRKLRKKKCCWQDLFSCTEKMAVNLDGTQVLEFRKLNLYGFLFTKLFFPWHCNHSARGLSKFEMVYCKRLRWHRRSKDPQPTLCMHD